MLCNIIKDFRYLGAYYTKGMLIRVPKEYYEGEGKNWLVPVETEKPKETKKAKSTRKAKKAIVKTK